MKYLSLGLATGLLTGCSSIANLTDTTGLIDYSNHKSVKVLEMPSDLKAPEYDRTYLTTVSDGVSQSSAKVSDAVPFVEGDLTSPSPEQVTVVDKGSEKGLSIPAGNTGWEKTIAALKAMGMTVNKQDQASGLIEMRDRSRVSEPGSMIGDFLNRTIGRVNQGAFYQAKLVQEAGASTIIFRNGEGGELSEQESNLLLNRFRKEYTGA